MLKTIIPTLDGVEEALHGFYKETDAKDGKVFVLQVTDIDDHPDVANLKSAFESQKATNTELRTKNTALETKSARLEGLPDDFDKKAYESLKSIAEGKSPDAAEVERTIAERVAKAEEKAAEKLTVAEADRDRFKSKFEGTIVDTALTNALLGSGVKDDIYLKAAKGLVGSKLQIVADGDEYSVIARDKYDTAIPVDSFIKDWAETEEGKRFVGAPSSQGGGGGGGGGSDSKGGKTMLRSQFDKLEPVERSKKMSEGFAVVDD